jgi:hypothetical protein
MIYPIYRALFLSFIKDGSRLALLKPNYLVELEKHQVTVDDIYKYIKQLSFDD